MTDGGVAVGDHVRPSETALTGLILVGALLFVYLGRTGLT